MKFNQIITWFCLSPLIACSSLAEEATVPHITVYGTATTEVVPDQMIWSLRVETKGRDLETVSSEHLKTVQSILDFLKKSDVDSKSVQTSRMEFGENWSYSSSARSRDGYIASTQISFKITNLGLYGPLWLGLANRSSVSVQSVRYDHTRRIEFQNQTREKAILAAKDKAVNCAKVLEVELGQPLLVEEDLSPSEGWSTYFGNNALLNNVRVIPGEGEGARNELVAPGSIPITIRVKAAFQLISKSK